MPTQLHICVLRRACILVAVVVCPSAAWAQACENLAALTLPSAIISSARTVSAGAFQPPPPPQGGPGIAGPPVGRYDNLPPFCQVTGRIATSRESSLRFEVWMPATGWNGNFLANGFAWYGGTMDPAVLAGALRLGYATATTDAGGDGTRAGRYLLNAPEKLQDWNERAWHETTVTAKALVAAYYGGGPRLSYWHACGGGTRQGLKEALRFPGDYDAMALGGLSTDTTHFPFANMWYWQASHRDEASRLPAEKFAVIRRGALAACDAKDGATDGLIQDPASCRFDPGVLQCSAGDAANCLTPGQVETARTFYAPILNTRTGERVYYPLMPGSELLWNSLAGTEPIPFAVEFFKYLAFKDLNWDYRTRPINLADDVALANRPELAAVGVKTTDADLSAFVARGGKILFYGGWNDVGLPPLFAVDYYKNAVSNVTTKLGASAADSALRLFMVPDMGHCPIEGGSGFGTAPTGYSLDAFSTLVDWVEKGNAPNTLVVPHRTNGTEDRTMLVCRYPQVARYREGSTERSQSFTCTAP